MFRRFDMTVSFRSLPPILSLKLSVLGLLVACLANPSRAQDKVELFGGYSYLRASVQVGVFGPLGPGTACPPNCGNPPTVAQHANLNGWEFSGQYKPLPFLGAAADFNGNYGTLDGGHTRIHTFLFGPQISLPAKVSPFAHVLVGVAKESQDAITNAAFFSLGSDKSLATAIGVGIDVKAIPLFSVRLIQIDYLRTQLHGATQNQPRVSAGIVFRF
jgi:hypothetical protein